MLYEGIIITGTSCAGKSTIAKRLCEDSTEDISFEEVRAVTTRERRADDVNYLYITNDEFDELQSKQKLLVSTTYRDKKYGIRKADYKDVILRHKIPILTITPSSVEQLLNENDDKYLCVFIDAQVNELINRKKERDGALSRDKTREFCHQNETDRNYSFKAHYIIKNNEIEASVSLIRLLWKLQNTGGGLSEKIIRSMIKCDVLLENADSRKIKGASYDLLLGDEYYYAGEIKKLSDEKPFLTIEPYDYAIVSCRETASMPRDVIAKFGLSVSLFCQGIILSNGPQIDPGFHGTLFCLLFNTSNHAVYLKRGQHYATIEFNKLVEPAAPYEGKYQGCCKIIDYIPANTLQGAINELKIEIEQLKSESRFMQNIYLGVAGLMFAIISILLIIR